MPYYVVAAGGTLYSLSTSGVATALTVPSDVSVSSTRRARMAVLGRNVIVVNAPNRSVTIAPNRTVRPLLLQPPASMPVVSASGAGSLTGNFLVKYTYAIQDTDKNIIAESDYSPTSGEVKLTNQKLQAIAALSTDVSTNLIRFYRTATGPGDEFFHWIDLNGNTKTTVVDDLSDEGIGIVAAPLTLGSAPGMLPGTHMTIVREWKGHLWGVGDTDIDTLRGSEAASLSNWPEGLIFDIAPLGRDRYGITGIYARRDELVIGKRKDLWKLVEDGDTFEPVKINGGKGIYGIDSGIVVDDTVYYLGEDGIYEYGASGILSLSDADPVTGRHGVRKWFTTDDYFNRAEFPNSIGRYNNKYDCLEWLLSAPGSTDLNRWISYDRKGMQWYGPHTTDKFTPTWFAEIVDANDLTVPIFGASNGHVYTANSASFRDDDVAIVMRARTKMHDGDAPDIEHVWGELSVLSKIQAAIGNLQIDVRIGGLDAAVLKTLDADQTLGREQFQHLGSGRLCSFEFSEDTIDQGCELYGYELPFFELGRR